MGSNRAPASAEYKRNRKIVRARDNDCWLCGGYVDKTLHRYHPLAAEVDHKISVEDGGGDELSNLALAHRVCNNDKGGSQSKKPREHYVRLRKANELELDHNDDDFLAIAEAAEEEYDE